MLKAKLEVSSLKNIIDSVKVLFNEAPFYCYENAIFLQAMDSSHVVLVSLKLSKSFFTSYRCDQYIPLGLNFAQVTQALEYANDDDSCLIQFGEQDGDNISFMFHDAAKTKIRTNTFQLMDIDNEHLGIPDQKYAATIEISSVEFAKACQELSKFSDIVTISSAKNGLNFFASYGSSSCSITYDGVTVKNKICSGKFKLKYLIQFAKASGLSDRVRLSLSEGVPIVVEFKINENDGYLRYYLAPKNDDNDDVDDDTA